MRKLKKTKVKLLVTLLSFVLLFCGTMGSSLAWLLDKTDDVTNTFTPSTIGVTLTETEREYKMIPGWTIPKDPKVTVKANSEDCYVFVKVEEGNNIANYISYHIDTDGAGSDPTITTDTNTNVTTETTLGGWIQLIDDNETLISGVYYRIVDKSENVQEFYVLSEHKEKFDLNTTKTDTEEDDTEFSWSNNQVLTKPTVTKEMMDSISSKPTLTFTAHACQLWKQNEPANDASDEEIAAAQFTPYEAWQLASTPTP